MEFRKIADGISVEQIYELQKQSGVFEIQQMIESGDAWHMEGSYGRAAMENLRSGACFLPEEAHTDYWGNHVPSRNEIQPGTTGSLELSQEFWSNHELEDFVHEESLKVLSDKGGYTVNPGKRCSYCGYKFGPPNDEPIYAKGDMNEPAWGCPNCGAIWPACDSKLSNSSVHEESLKDKTAGIEEQRAIDYVHPSEKRKIRDIVMGDESLRRWMEEEVEDMTNELEVNYFIRDHAIDLANAINRGKKSASMKKNSQYKAGEENSIFTVDPEEMFHCPYCGVRIDHDVNGRFMESNPGVIYTARCQGCGKEMSVEWDSKSTDDFRTREEKNMRGIEGSLKMLKAAPDFQMEMQLGDIISAPYTTQIELYITELLKQQSELPISLPEGFSVDILEGDADYHAESKPIEGFPGSVAVHEWYCSGKFEIVNSEVTAVIGRGDFGVDGLWNSEDGEVVGNNLTILNLIPGGGEFGNDPDNEPSQTAWAND